MRMGQTYGCRILVRKPQGHRPSGRAKCRREGITCFKMMLEGEYEGVH
jgi:hypothetical protein